MVCCQYDNDESVDIPWHDIPELRRRQTFQRVSGMSEQRPQDQSLPVTIETPIEVRYAETDQMGVVHHSNYLVWFELARTRLCAETEWPYDRIEKDLGVWLMVTGVHLDYRGGARYGEQVTVRCWVDRLASRVMHFAYEVHRGEELLVRGRTEHTWVVADSMKICRMPAEVKPSFERLAGH